MNLKQKKLIGIRFPSDRLLGNSRTQAEDAIFLRASFKSDDVFFGRIKSISSVAHGFGTDDSNTMIVTGGGTALISFELEEK